MKLIFDWIAEWVDLAEITPEELGDKLTKHSAEMEGVHHEAKDFESMVFGRALEITKHPDADRLNIVKVDIGEDQAVQIVCGGTNLQEAMGLAIALPGSKVRWHGEGELVEIKKSAVRGVESFGMICAGEEIGLASDNPEGATSVRIHDLSWSKAPSGTPLAPILKKDKSILEIDNKSITHRPDLWGHYGFAREASAIFKRPLKALDAKLFQEDLSHGPSFPLEVQSPELSRRAYFIRVEGIQNQESPEWIQSRLLACGIKSNGLIVDITNYVMVELGQPLHAYDTRHVQEGFKIRYAKKGESLLLLNGETQALFEKDIIIADGKDNPLILAGIKGGMYSGVKEDTNSIYLEAAHWDPIVIRTSSQKHGLRTDASQRYEKSLDPYASLTALRRALALLKDFFPEMSLSSCLVSWEPSLAESMQIPFSVERFARYTGLELSEENIAQNLEALGFEVDKNSWLVTVPSHRASGDISLEEDLIEEVARIHGYEAIPNILPELPAQIPTENLMRSLNHRLRNIMAYEMGYKEMNTYSFYSQNLCKKFTLNEADHFILQNPLSEENSHMRCTLIPNLLVKAIDNSSHFTSMRLFELGRSYEKTSAFMPIEKPQLAFMYASLHKKDSHQSIFHQIFSDLDTLFARMKLKNWKLIESPKPSTYAHTKLSYDIIFQGRSIGSIFCIHPRVLTGLDSKLLVFAAELNLEGLELCSKKIFPFEEPSKFPSSNLDVSIVVPKKSLVGEWEKTMRQADKNRWIQTIILKDIYQGDPIPEDKKSISFAISLQNSKTTIDENAFRETQEQLFLAIEKNGGIIRGR